jgi:transcriptional regulator with XRE-family HTH domain
MFRVKELAEERGMNITTLAGRAGMAYSQVYGVWSNTTKRPALTTLERIAKALGVPVWALFQDAPPPP